MVIPPVLKPNFDLLRLNVSKDRTLPDQLLSSQRTRFRALGVDSLKRLHLLRRVPHILAGRIKVLVDTTTAALPVLLSNHHRHFSPTHQRKGEVVEEESLELSFESAFYSGVGS